MALFESYERRIDKINEVLNSYGIASLEEAEKITKDAGLDVYNQIKGIQPICFENACWAYITGAAIAIKKGCETAADAAAAIGEGLQAFCIPGSVADQRKVGLGHGNLGKMLLEETTDCFCFLAGHESFAAAEGAIGIAEKANKVRKKPLRVILNGLGKDAAKIISRMDIMKIRVVMGVALLLVAVVTLCKINAIGPFGILGTARGLEGGLLVAGVAANFVLGILMTAGIGLYAPCMAVVLLLGMSADVAFPVMMGSCAYLCPACGITFIKEGKYNRAATIPMIISGSIGVLIAGFIVTSLPLTILTYLVCVVMVICAVMFFHDARKQTK